MKNTTKLAIGVGALVGVGAVAGAVLLNSLNNLVSHRDDPIYDRMQKKRALSDTYDTPQKARIREAKQWLSEQPLEEVFVTSHDGLKLKGHLLTCPDAKRTEILVHGWREPWQDDMGMMTRYQTSHQCNVLIVEQRSHGDSEGEYIGFGVLERYDCQVWAEYIAERLGPDLPIYLGGVSMGASSVLMAAGLELPKNVKGIIADCGFTSPRAIVAHVITRNTGLPEHPVVPLIDLINRRKAGYGYSDYSTIEAMKQNELPVLFVHGDEDSFVPLAMTLENYLACKAPKDLLIVEGATHGMSYLVDSAAYEQALQDFFQKCEAE